MAARLALSSPNGKRTELKNPGLGTCPKTEFKCGRLSFVVSHPFGRRGDRMDGARCFCAGLEVGKSEFLDGFLELCGWTRNAGGGRQRQRNLWTNRADQGTSVPVLRFQCFGSSASVPAAASCQLRRAPRRFRKRLSCSPSMGSRADSWPRFPLEGGLTTNSRPTPSLPQRTERA